jgi:hypothetical protein
MRVRLRRDVHGYHILAIVTIGSTSSRAAQDYGNLVNTRLLGLVAPIPEGFAAEQPFG